MMTWWDAYTFWIATKTKHYKKGIQQLYENHKERKLSNLHLNISKGEG